MHQTEADFKPIPFDAVAVRAFGQVAADLRRSGRKTSARACDALIAATAIANGLPLYTINRTTTSESAASESSQWRTLMRHTVTE